jgi:hypothetical protein
MLASGANLIQTVKFPFLLPRCCTDIANQLSIFIQFLIFTRLTYYLPPKSFIQKQQQAAKQKAKSKEKPLYAHLNRKSPPFSPRKSTNGWQHIDKKKYMQRKKATAIDLNVKNIYINILQLFVKVIKSFLRNLSFS